MSDIHPPTDSVLRRHWEATQPAAPTASAPSRQQTASAENSSNSAPAEGGFFGWLKRLFS